MRFGGHQTFYIRDGWLYKGLELLITDPAKLTDEFSFDYLGVGRNMTNSIQHWLQSTELAVKEGKVAGRGRPSKELIPTLLAKTLWNSDRFFTLPDTLWILHINMLHNRTHGETWYWFFNKFSVDRFDRTQCQKRLIKYTKEDLSGKPPTSKTIERDLSCFFNTYCTEIPARNIDPEEDLTCPFRDLELMFSYRDSGNIQVQRHFRPIAPEILMYAIELCLQPYDADITQESTDIKFFDLVRLDNNPLRVFLLSTDNFFELLLDIAEAKPDYLSVVGLAGERQIRITRRNPVEWLRRFYESRSEIA